MTLFLVKLEATLQLLQWKTLKKIFGLQGKVQEENCSAKEDFTSIYNYLVVFALYDNEIMWIHSVLDLG